MSDSGTKSCLGCGIGCAVLFFGLPIVCGIFSISKVETKNFFERRKEKQAEEARREEVEKVQNAEAKRMAELRRKQEAVAAEAERKRQTKADKIRTFALKDAPKVWEVYQALKSEIDVQNGRIEELRKTLVSFDRSPEQDEDFNRICAQRDEMIRSQKALYVKLEDAYIAACKFAATPSRKDYNDLQKKALEDGIKEAESAAAKFKELRLNK